MAPSCAGSIPVVRLSATQPNLGTVRAKGKLSAPQIVWAQGEAKYYACGLACLEPSIKSMRSLRRRRSLAVRSTGALGTRIASCRASGKVNSRHSLAIGLEASPSDSGILEDARRGKDLAIGYVA